MLVRPLKFILMKNSTVVSRVGYRVLSTADIIVSTKVRRRTRTGLIEWHLYRNKSVVDRMKDDFVKTLG